MHRESGRYSTNWATRRTTDDSAIESFLSNHIESNFNRIESLLTFLISSKDWRRKLTTFDHRYPKFGLLLKKKRARTSTLRPGRSFSLQRHLTDPRQFETIALQFETIALTTRSSKALLHLKKSSFRVKVTRSCVTITQPRLTHKLDPQRKIQKLFDHWPCSYSWLGKSTTLGWWQ